jgi:spore coat polysaccharide biosynthesis protein SpsF
MPAFAFKNADEQACAGLRTLVMQEMIKRGVLFQGVFIISYSHTEDDLNYFCKAFDEVLTIYKLAVVEGYEKYLVGNKAEAVFRRIL